MSQRYTKSVSSLVSFETDRHSPSPQAGYGTRNNSKRRKLNTPPLSPAEPLAVPPPGLSPTAAKTHKHSPMYSRNLDKALKSILSENPKLHASAREEHSEETASSSIRQVVSTASLSSHNNSRETTPSSLAGEAGETSAFIAFYEREREAGRVKAEVREEALQVLREWREEWIVEDKRVRELRRRIKSYTATAAAAAVGGGVQVDVSSGTADGKGRSRGRTSTMGTTRSSPTGGRMEVSSAEMEEGTVKARSESPSRSRSVGRRDSITGPNGLTGTYWDVPLDEMGRGSRRKSKV